MKTYTATYLKHFGYGLHDFVACEVCGAKAVDIHHIKPGSTHKKLENDINNLMALCRKCHEDFGDKKQHRQYLQKIHDEEIIKKYKL